MPISWWYWSADRTKPLSSIDLIFTYYYLALHVIDGCTWTHCHNVYTKIRDFKSCLHHHAVNIQRWHEDVTSFQRCFTSTSSSTTTEPEHASYMSLVADDVSTLQPNWEQHIRVIWNSAQSLFERFRFNVGGFQCEYKF